MTTNQPWTGQDSFHNSALPIPANQPFWLMHHPNTCWEFIHLQDRWMFIPDFRRLFEIAGCNGVRMIPRGGTDSQMARVKMMDDGFEVLDLELGYQTRHRCTNGWYYANVFDTPKILGNRVIWKRDEQGWAEWRLQLLKDSVLQQPDPDILELFLEKQEKRVNRNEGKNFTPRLKKMYDFDVLRLEMMKKCIEDGNPIHPPRKKGKRNV